MHYALRDHCIIALRDHCCGLSRCRLQSVGNYEATADGTGATLLHVAAEEGNPDLLAELLNPGYDSGGDSSSDREPGGERQRRRLVDATRLDGTTPLSLLQPTIVYAHIDPES
jgi:hypothetical protein